MKTVRHNAPSLNAELVGELDDDAGLALFRGIPYAEVNKRWTHSRTKNSLESPFDATQFGPRCPQVSLPVLVSGYTPDPDVREDEFKCLNLNIAIPKEALPGLDGQLNASPLPVMVWIHG